MTANKNPMLRSLVILFRKADSYLFGLLVKFLPDGVADLVALLG